MGHFATVAFPPASLQTPLKTTTAQKNLSCAGKKYHLRHAPFFIWQTNSDDPRNSFVLGAALTEAGVPFELHCFPDGVHDWRWQTEIMIFIWIFPMWRTGPACVPNGCMDLDYKKVPVELHRLSKKAQCPLMR